MARPLRASLMAVVPLAVSFAVLLGVNLLPPDTALAEIDEAGRLTVCAPQQMGPLATRDRDRPGFEVALIQEAARRAGWRIGVTASAAMGREYNPGNWRISRATCRLVVAGLRENTWTRSLFEMGDPYLRSSWVWVAPQGTAWPPEGAAFAPGVYALDRVALGTYLRGQGVQVTPVQNTAALAKAMQSGEASVAITDQITAQALFGASDLTIAPLPGGPEPVGISFGVWKGDTTLRWHMDRLLADMAEDGTIARIAADYGLGDSLMR